MRHQNTPIIYIIYLFILTTLFTLACSRQATARQYRLNGNNDDRIEVVVIDPGHGGKDAGAMYGAAREKDIVLDIGLKLGKYISAAFPDVKVIYTRSTDVFVPLHQRASIANKNKADLFISIHVNAVTRGLVQGTETFILGQHRTRDNLEVAKQENAVILLEDDYSTTYEGFDPNSPESYIMFELVQDEYLEQSAMLASAIQNQFRERAKRIDRSVKQAGFLVLRQTTMPSVLVETGFLSHPTERNYLMSENGRDYLASAIFRAFRDYKKKIEQKSSFRLVSREQPEMPNIINNPGNNNESLASPGEKQEPGQKNIFFSVQIAALERPLKITHPSFKGEPGVFEINGEKMYRYYVGKFNSVEKARSEKARLQAKFSGAFVVAFENNELISVKKALRKM